METKPRSGARRPSLQDARTFQAYRPTQRVYRPRQPTATPLYPVVQHHLETFLASTESEAEAVEGVPFWVEQDFRAYLECGILAHGFARARCGSCGYERLIASAARAGASAPLATPAAWPRWPLT